MADPISFDPFLGWVDSTDPNNIPQDARVIGANDLLRYENFGKDAAAAINEIAAAASDTGLATLMADPTSDVSTQLGIAVSQKQAAELRHDFTGDTVRPDVADSGHGLQWSWTGASKITFSAGLMFNDGTAGQYYLDSDPINGPTSTVGVECVFFTGDTTGMVYGSWSQRITDTGNGGWATGLKSRAHIILYTDRLEYYINATGNAPAAVLIKTQTLPTPLTQYADTAAWIAAGSPTNKVVTTISGNTAVTIVNGVALPPISHAGIQGTDRYPFWEAYKPNVGVKSIWAGTTPELSALVPAAEIAQAAAAAQLKADQAYAAAPTETLRIEAGAMALRYGSPAYTALGAGGTPKWLFDAATTEQVAMLASVPKGWSTYDAVLVCFNETTATGNVRLQLSIQVLNEAGEVIGGTVQTAPGLAFAAAGQGIRSDHVIATNVARTSTGQLRLSVLRQGEDATDTLGGDYALVRVELRKKS